MTKTSWRELMSNALLAQGETWADVEAMDLAFPSALDMRFENDHGGPHGPPAPVLWTARRVYQGSEYDGAVGVTVAPRHPTGCAVAAALEALPREITDDLTMETRLERRLNDLIDRLQPPDQLDPARDASYRDGLIALERLSDRIQAPAFTGDEARRRAERISELALTAQDILAQTMANQGIRTDTPRAVARALTPQQRRTLKHATLQAILIAEGVDCATRTAQALADRGLLHPCRSIQTSYTLTGRGRAVATELTETGVLA